MDALVHCQRQRRTSPYTAGLRRGHVEPCTVPSRACLPAGAPTYVVHMSTNRGVTWPQALQVLHDFEAGRSQQGLPPSKAAGFYVDRNVKDWGSTGEALPVSSPQQQATTSTGTLLQREPWELGGVLSCLRSGTKLKRGHSHHCPTACQPLQVLINWPDYI